MIKEEVKKIIETIEQAKDRNIVIVDYSNLVHFRI